MVAYHSGPALLRCLESLAAETRALAEVIVVNNGERADEIREAERMTFVRVVSPGTNAGFAEGCNVGSRHAKGETLFFVNPDTVVAPGAVAELAKTLEDRSIGIAMPRLRLLQEPDLLNSAGNVVHITGLAWAGGYRSRADDLQDLRDVPYASGAAMAIRADLFRELGGFTGELFLYQEDLELSWRARLRGLRVVLDPRADVYHEYEYARHPRKLYFLERNRLIFVLSSFSPRLLVLLAPLLACAEVSLALRAWRQGWFREKAAGWTWCLRNARWLARHRRETQRLRTVDDRELADMLTPVIDPGMVEVPRALASVNRIVASYWSLVRAAL